MDMCALCSDLLTACHRSPCRGSAATHLAKTAATASGVLRGGTCWACSCKHHARDRFAAFMRHRTLNNREDSRLCHTIPLLGSKVGPEYLIDAFSPEWMD